MKKLSPSPRQTTFALRQAEGKTPVTEVPARAWRDDDSGILARDEEGAHYCDLREVWNGANEQNFYEPRYLART